jgi:predicted GTPase
MLTIEDLQKIMNLPNEPSPIDMVKVNKVIEFKEEFTSFLDNLNIFTIDFINGVNGILGHWAMLQQSPWLKDKCIIGMMGGYNTGKSSLLNALLNIDLPTGVNPVTAISTYVAYGKENKHCLVDSDDNLKAIPNDLISRLSHEESQGFNFRQLIQHTVLFQSNEQLRNISFLDTPGITADNDYDYQITADAANKCDVVMWLIKSFDGAITKFEIDFIKEYLENKRLYIVLTYADRVPNIQNIENSIKNQLSSANIGCEGFFYFAINNSPRINVSENLNAMKNRFKNEATIYQQFQPQERLDEYTEYVKQFLNDKIKEATEKRNTVDQYCRDFERSINQIHQSLIDNVNSVTNCINSINSTIINRCQGVTFCVGAYSELKEKFDHTIDIYNNMVGCVNKFDKGKMINYGKASSYLDRLKEYVEKYTKERNKCVSLINKSKNLLR